jgi:hypothetical protein
MVRNEWPLLVRWVIVNLSTGWQWESPDVRSPTTLAEQLAAGLNVVGNERKPLVMWEMRDASGHLLGPAEQAKHLEVLNTVFDTLQEHGL